jgi:hypothetical protein
MADISRLSQELAALEDTDWYQVWEDAKDIRQQELERRFPYEEPSPGMSRDQFARWIAFDHLRTNPYVRNVLHLSDGAAADEIRLLEINVGIAMPEELKATAEDFTYDIDGSPFRVFVADVTPRQWERIRKDAALLPDGWSLTGSQNFGWQS